MKIFVCTDLHGQYSCLNWIDSHLNKEKYDGVFMLGDLCNGYDPNGLAYAANFIDLIKDKYKLPLFVVHGNQESGSVKLLYIKKLVSVHLVTAKLGEYEIAGVGYGSTLPDSVNYAKGKIFLTHEPPRSVMIAKMKEKGSLPNSPLIHLTGHLHSIAKVHHIGQTMLVQVPSLMTGRAASLELPSRQVKFIMIK
jgi:Icc-related predicted phosphoesterase